MTEIICYDTEVPEIEKKVTLAIVPITTSSWTKRVGLFKVIRTNGKITETVVTAPFLKGKHRPRKVRKASPDDIFDYEQDVKKDERRNDRLMKDVNEAYNLLFKKGYLCKILGLRGRVKEIDYRSAKLIINTNYDSKVICALLELYFPNREWRVV